MDWFNGMFSLWVMWFIVAGALLVAELTLSGFVAVFLAAGAGIAGVTAWFGIGLPFQLLVMAVVSTLGIVYGKKLLTARFGVNKEVLRTNVDALIGREAVVTKRITAAEKGRIDCRGESWLAEGEDGREYGEGELVVVRKIQGVTAVVSRKPVSLKKT
ncbi:NfeD family protein [Aneurinibacillus terranovensis]|uniref:NfeD family protein n=1 Tax=Aneurinibacillus terranovensis TaxID=278991 RepID=UPI0004239661|nr:NfeD family protein [Aneurinibacillus terranovensis]